ncbi:MAG: sugar phosphate isomerase/epimerase [Candidatus Hydrogenedentes bacterium]|nr:sugar phosphate isomerase/epimerase [Candidatus Hydrogenedentota bacterium]
MSDWPVGLSTGSFYQTSILDCLETIRNGGFSMIEVCSFASHLDYHDVDKVKATAKRLKELGMEAYSFHAPFSPDIDITSLNRERRDFAVREIIKAAEASAILEVWHFNIHPGPEESYRPPAQEYVERIRNAAEALNKVARRCGELGIGIVLENMLPHLLFGNTSDMLWLIGAMETVKIGACLDTGHAFLSGDLHNVMHKLSGHLQFVHVNDTRGRHDDHLPPGYGKVNWKRLLTELSRTGFRGSFILELAGNRPHEEILEDARQARIYIRDISRGIALSIPPTAAPAVASD